MDPVVLLDSHVLVWLDSDAARLSRAARKAITNARRKLLADISLREIAAMSSSTVDFGDVDARIAARSVRIAQNFHGDPADQPPNVVAPRGFDQLIAATAIQLDVPLITADERLRASPAVRTIW